MSRRIEPGEDLSPDDQKYLRDRGITLDEHTYQNAVADAIAEDIRESGTVSPEVRVAIGAMPHFSARVPMFLRRRR